MIHAYDEMYLADAMHSLGEMFDYAAQECHMELDKFFDLFLASGLSDAFGKGVPRVVSGLSGTELALEVFDKAGLTEISPPAGMDYARSPEYWSGWVLAYYQWYTGRSFREVRRNISMREILNLYPALHEASEDRFVDSVNRMMRLRAYETRLQALRKAAGYSQRELAERSGVNLRTLQQYEIRSKDINKAAAVTLAALARVLCCRIEDLLEYNSASQ